MMRFSSMMGGYFATDVGDFDGWHLLSSVSVQGKGKMYLANIAKGKERRAVYA